MQIMTEGEIPVSDYLILNSYKDISDKEWEQKGKQFKAQAGQFVANANSIMSKSAICISQKNVRTTLIKFKKYDFLTYESTKTGILVIIVNQGAYQGEKTIVNQAVSQFLTNISPTYNH